MAFTKLKYPRSAAPRRISDFLGAIADASRRFTPQGCASSLSAAQALEQGSMFTQY